MYMFTDTSDFYLSCVLKIYFCTCKMFTNDFFFIILSLIMVSEYIAYLELITKES